MDDVTRFEDRFEERVRAFAKTGVQPVDSGAVARAAAVGHPKSAAIKPDQRGRLDEIRRPRSISRTTFAAAAVVAMLALGGALLAVAGRPSPSPSADPSPSLPVVVAPSPEPSATATNPSAFPRTTGVWIATGSMGTPRSGHTAVRLLDGRVLVAGGYPGSEPDDAVTSAELYDPETGTWSPTGNMLKPHGGFPATLLRDGRVLVGDVDNPAADIPVLGAEVFDPASETWTATGKMVTPTDGSATLLRDGRVLVDHEFGDSELFDPDSGTWTATGQMLAYFHQPFATVLMPDGKVLVAGGGADTGYAGEAAELYDPESGTWTSIANMNGPKEVISATLLRDGTVLVMGNGFLRPMPPELYHPATGAWTVVGEPGDYYRSTTLLSDGTVLVAGPPQLPDAKLYDPGTGSWTSTGSMLRLHDGTLLDGTLLLDGTVLVAGGRDCLEAQCVTTGSADLYVPAGVSPPAAVAALPSPTPVPTPTPIPPPPPVPPAVGPVPQGARTWTVTVDNRSSEPATLFEAEDGETGVGRLCGNVTPNVVPPDTSMKVTFLLPPKNVTSCWIWVNPVPGEGGSFFQTSDAPLEGGFLIDEGGQEMWGGAP